MKFMSLWSSFCISFKNNAQFMVIFWTNVNFASIKILLYSFTKPFDKYVKKKHCFIHT